MLTVIKQVFIGERTREPENEINFGVGSYKEGHELMRNLISIDRALSEKVRNKHYPVRFDEFSNGLGFLLSYVGLDGLRHHNAYGIIDEDEDSD